ncbi:MAG: HTH domain-containing protein, partial [Gammaproteobacteria bacterium]|nr:HTH domain-containing protein [Gammaproteobacteria bacterium]
MLTENVSSDASSKVQMGDSDVTLPESLRSSRWLAPAVHDDQPGTNDPRELRWSNEVGFSSCCQMMAGCNMVVSPSPAKLHMSRTSRLFDLIQTLRNHRFPVTGAHLAKELGISLRTLYRDIATLQAQGADIEGEP